MRSVLFAVGCVLILFGDLVVLGGAASDSWGEFLSYFPVGVIACGLGLGLLYLVKGMLTKELQSQEE